MAEIVTSEIIIKVALRTVFGIPVGLSSTPRHGKIPYYLLTGMLLTSIWLAFSYDMYCVKTYWRSSLKPHIPIETLLLLIPLNLSGAITYTLMVWYFYSNDFQHSHTRLVSHFDFMPEGHEEDIGPTRNDWKYVNIFLLFGVLIVLLVLYCAFGLNVFFDFEGLHDFTIHIHHWKRDLYYFNVSFIYWGFASSVIACCIFYICCRDIVRHVEFTENLIITKARDYLTARHYHECLLRYTDDIISTTKTWFVIHSLFFMFIVSTDVFVWIMAFSEIKHQHHNIIFILVGQIAGSSLIAFKFAFPFLAASRVTARYDIMYRRINRQWRPNDLTEVDPFMCYAIRSQAGFTLFGVRLTAEWALISFLSCFIGLFKLYKKII